MGLEETQKRLLSLSHQNLQSFCKQYNLPANKTHSQLASSLAVLLEKEKLNSGPEREKIGSTQASPVPSSPATPSAVLPNNKEASRCGQDNHKRGTYSDRDDADRPHVKHQKVSKKQADAALTSGTRTSLPPVSVNNGKVDCFSSCSGQGIAHNVNSQTADGVATSSTALELKTGNHVSAAPVNDTISFIASHPVPNGVVSESRSHKKVGGSGIEKGSGSSNDIPAKKNSPFHLFVMSDEGIDLFCDLDSTPGDWIDSFKGGVSIPPSIHHTETEMLSNSISSLRSKNDQNANSSSDNIIMNVENKGPESIAAQTNSSLGSTDCENSRSRFCPPDRTVNSSSPTSTLPGTLGETSGSQEGVPVVHSSCLTSDVQNNMSLDMMAAALGNNMLPQESVDVSALSGRGHAPLPYDSVQPTKEDMLSPGKTKVCVKTGCTQDVVVISDSDEDSSAPFVDKQEMPGATSGVKLTRNSDTNEVLTEGVPIEAVPMEEDNSHGDTLSIDQIAKQTVAGLPATDAQSDASSADRGVAGNFNLADPTTSSVAPDNAITPLASKHGAEAANSQASEGLPSVRTRNILFSLRSAAARRTRSSTVPRHTRSSTVPRQTRSTTVPRRSPRLVPQ
ncbi:uncharacterized protein [Lolium perenne]|uniref:uncharacterized protein n=1 Tax=Lolium perenne TaxID=4522 RepID=UPI0021F5920D|nr:uncharacterized protein LOC127302417 [Lolium perenne]XP_051188835.1 uncharacterized protein LOC127302417 [Lolium perenne]